MHTENGLLLDPTLPGLPLGGWPAIGAGVEGNAVFAQAGGSATKGYVGIVGVAPRTFIRIAAVVPSASSVQQFALIRQVTGAALLTSAFAPLFRVSDVVQAHCIGGADQTVLGPGTPHILVGFPPAFTGTFNLAGSDFLGLPLVLFPGDALVVLSGTVNVTATLTVNICEMAT